MKKSLSIITLIVLVAAMAFTLAACQPNLPDEDIAPTSVTLYTPDGAPAMSVAKIIADGKIGDTTATVEIAQNAQDIVAKATKAERELELAVLPTNAAATVYNATKGDYVLFSINTYGLLYIMGTEEVLDLNALKGQVLYSIGMGQVPQYVFDKVLAHAGIQKVNNSDVAEEGKLAVKYTDNAQGINPLLLQGKAKFGLLGEPAATQLVTKAAAAGKTIYRLFDVQQLWKDAVGGTKTGYPQACLIVKKSLLANKTFAAALDRAMSANAAYLAENVGTLKSTLAGAGSKVDVDYTTEIIARCNISYIKANSDGLKAELAAYLAEFGFSANGVKPSDKLPDDAFYYAFD